MKNINKILATLSLASSDTREDTIKSIIRTTLRESKEPIALNILKENIAVIYEIELYDIEFSSILKKLDADNEIQIYKDLYSLSDEEKAKLIEIETKLKVDEFTRFQNFKAFIESKSEILIEEPDIKLLWNTLKDYMYGCFYQYGVKAIEFLHPQYINSESASIHNGEVFSEALKRLGKQELSPIFKFAVDGFPDYATKEDLDFIDEIGQKALAFASLGLSPEQANDELDSELINWTLYLDTNFLFSVLDLHTNNENEACKELLKLVALNKDIIRIKFRYSELTLKELRHKKSDFANLDESLTDSAIRAILKSDDLDEFARKYYSDLLNHRDETIHPTQIIDLAEVTLPKTGIEISRSQRQIDSFGEEYIDSQIVEYQRFINEINAARESYNKEHHTFIKSYFRYDSQIRHDVILRELILSSRKQFKKNEIKTLNEVKYFGVTLDELLMKYDSKKNKSLADGKYPTFFRPSFLLNKLVKLLPVKTLDYKKAFIKAVSSRGYFKELQKSNDIIKVASYLKRLGIDNENVLLNLINERLFMDKFHQESSNPDFNSEKFFESEINIILAEKEKEVIESKIQITQLAEETLLEREEKEKLRKLNDKKEGDISMLSSAVEQLNKQLKILEARPILTSSAPTLNFEAAEKQKELETVQSELIKQKQRIITLENEKREPLRKKFIKEKIFMWRLNTFLYILLGATIFLSTIAYIYYLGDWKNQDTIMIIEQYKGNLLITALVWLGSVFFSGFFIKRFSDQFSQTNVNAFKANMQKKIPSELKEISE
jgi:hypothetical protein